MLTTRREIPGLVRTKGHLANPHEARAALQGYLPGQHSSFSFTRVVRIPS